MSNAPIKKFSLFGSGVELAVWANDKGGVSITMQKRYKDKTGEWKETKYLNPADVAVLSALAAECGAYLQNVGRAVSPETSGAQRELVSALPANAQQAPDDDDIPF